MALHNLELPDQQIDDAITQREWRHALQLIEKREKRLKKNESLDWLTACKASVLLLLPEASKQRQGRALLDSLYERKPPVVDVAAVMAIQAFAEDRKDADARIDGLWTQAANTYPNNEQLHRHWFKIRFSAKDWQGAQKAAMAYMKHFPSKREPFFWTIFANFMAAKSPKTSEQEKTLYSAMAYRMCAKAAEDVKFQAEEELKSGRVLRTPGDIAFLLDAYQSQGKWNEALAVLESDRTGITSRVGKRSWDLVLRKFQLSEYVGQWLDQFRYCSTLLQDARPNSSKAQTHGFGESGNNWSVWVAMLRAVANLHESTAKVEDWFPELAKTTGPKHRVILPNVAATICAQDSEHSKGRHGMCAKMLFDLSNLATQRDSRPLGAALVESCCTYFKVYGSKQFCFNDLQMFLQALDPTGAQSLLREVRAHLKKQREDLFGEQDEVQDLDDLEAQSVHDAAYLIINVNVLKIEYHLIHSQWRVPEESKDSADIDEFIVECIKLYNTAISSYPDGEIAKRPTERLPGDDAGFLAAIGLIQLHSLWNRPKALLQAVTILEHLVEKSPFNYEALVTLTALYTKLGVGWLAAEHYSRLSIKNIQYPTVSWLLSTRISTVYPHTPQTGYKDSTAKADADPVHHLARALEYHLQLRESDQQEIIGFLEAGQYASLIQAMGNSIYNQLGFTRYMLLVELARIERLSETGQKLEYRRLADDLPPIALDNRDRSPVPQWETPDATSLEEMVLPGTWPSHKWLSQQAFIALSFDHGTQQNKFFTRDDVMNSTIAVNDFKESSTPVEDSQINLARDFDWISMIYDQKVGDRDPRNRSAETVSQKATKIRDWQQYANYTIATMVQNDGCHLREIAENAKVPDWEFFHEVYVGLDNCKLVEKSMDVIEVGNRKYRIIGAAEEHANNVRELCNEYRGIVHAAALHLRESFYDKKQRRNLVYSIVGRQEDSEDKDPIAYWLRNLLNGEQYVQTTLAKLIAAWKDALRNIADLSQPKPSTQMPLR